MGLENCLNPSQLSRQDSPMQPIINQRTNGLLKKVGLSDSWRSSICMISNHFASEAHSASLEDLELP